MMVKVKEKKGVKKSCKNCVDKKYILKFILYLALLMVLINGVWHGFLKPLPEGLSFEGEIRNVPAENIEFLRDITFNCAEGSFGTCERDHEIFDKIFGIVDNAEEFILIDMFLIGNSRNGFRNLSLELSQALIEKKKENPEIKINFVTDYLNVNYNAKVHEELESMSDAGINVVYTDLRNVRDSNFIYSAFWRSFVAVFGRSSLSGGWFSAGGKMWKARSVLEWANAKANHRKVVVADNGEGEFVSLITSANPDDWGSGYSNVGLYFNGGFAKDFYNAEKAVADFSGDFLEYDFEEDYSGDVEVQVLTEGKIKKGLIEEIDKTIAGEEIKIAMFLLSERDVIGALKDASERGVNIKLILDPSSHLFGKNSKGIPNVAASKDLVDLENVEIVWYNSGDQEFHSKMTVITKADGKTIVFLGSANLTRRNIDDYNLEMIVKVVANSDEIFVQDIYDYFDLLWSDEKGIYVVEYDSFKTPGYGYVKYRFQEATGLSAF